MSYEKITKDNYWGVERAGEGSESVFRVLSPENMPPSMAHPAPGYIMCRCTSESVARHIASLLNERKKSDFGGWNFTMSAV